MSSKSCLIGLMLGAAFAVCAVADAELDDSAEVIGWGADSWGQATLPDGVTNVVAVSAGGAHSLALLSDGTVVGWGWNGNDQNTIPVGL